jgi:competence protein ComEA
MLCYAVLAVALGWGLIAQWGGSESVLAEPGAMPARMSEVQTRIDPNVADWSELVRLPGIGETLAKRIVAYRRQQAAQAGQGPVFGRLEDLDAVRGIGPKKLAQMAEYLAFPGPQERNSPEMSTLGGVDTSAQTALE